MCNGPNGKNTLENPYDSIGLGNQIERHVYGVINLIWVFSINHAESKIII